MEAKKTPFYEMHVLAHAKMVDFAGYKMPMFYKGIVPEHMRVRSTVGVFDITHMGEFMLKGPDAGAFIAGMITNNSISLPLHKVQYSAMCYDNGTIVDDLLVYRLGQEEWMLVVNASNMAKDWKWLSDHKQGNFEMTDVSDTTALIAVQGPKSEATLQPLTRFDLSTLPYYTCATIELAGIKLLLSRTGYTGEDGFEIYHKPEDSQKLWDAVMKAGEPFGIEPIGLGARDSLRLEMKYALYGHDIDDTTNPIEAGLSWVVSLDKPAFIGKDALIAAKENLTRRLVCLETRERSFPRQGYEVVADGNVIGSVTSGTFSPSIEKGIAIAYVDKNYAKIGAEVGIQIRDRVIMCDVVKPPFYKNGSVKSN